MEPSVTEQLVKFLRDKKTDYVTMGKLSALPAALKKQIVKKGRFNDKIQKAIQPYLGDALILKRKGLSVYLVIKQGDDDLLFKIIASRAEKSEKSLGVLSRDIPFKKDEFLTITNRLLTQGRVRVTRINNQSGRGYLPFLAPAETKQETATPDRPVSAVSNVSEEAFLSAFGELERARAFVRICDLRRRLDWPRPEFDATLCKLRDAGIIQLHAGNVTTQTPDEVEDGFVDENGYRMGNVTRLA
ncbi:hypothetical protein FACS1894187_15110 [Synergistales bacterium]|nr:hypothetical protein FACS1894187_15110 [Synergistales bacterium]